MTAAVSELLTWLTGGSAPASLVKVLVAVCALALGLLYRRYLGILGADRRKPAERQAYDALRNSLGEGNLAARLYAERLTRFLNWIDHFFGDAGMANWTIFPHAFGLKTSAPLWTAPAFDRSLLLALLYPLVTIFAIWAISGHVGPAEAALLLAQGLPTWQRGLTVIASACLVAALYCAKHERGWRRLLWIAFAVTDAVTIAVVGAVSGFAHGFGAVAVGYAVFGSVFGALVFADAAVGVGVGAVAVSVAVTVIVAGAGFVGAAAVFVGFPVALVVSVVNDEAVSVGWQGLFQCLLVMTMIATCFAAARLISPSVGWELAGPWLLFLGLLTLVKAPFDWASLGLTRSLLRRGLELGGWWPYALALVDAGLAALIIAALALTMVVGVEAFNALAVNGGGTPVLPLKPLFDGIADRPRAPEYWWIYALLLSTMIPSLVNLVIGGSSLLRGLPGLPSLLLRFIPARGTVPKFDRAWIATVLTAQVALGAALGIAAQALLVIVIIGYVMPFFGLELLDMARDVAAFNLPARVGQLFGVGL